jgi:hypothetical protein
MEILKKKIQDLASENATLREINVKFQLENYNLQKRIRQLESTQLHPPQSYMHEIESVEDEFDDESNEVEQSKELFEVVETLAEEYLEEFNESSQENYQEPPNKKGKFQYEIHEISGSEIQDQNQMPVIVRIETADAKEDSDSEYNDESVKEAMEEICKLAASRGTLDKIKQINTGKYKDSAFVSKTLDLVFDKYTLAASSAQGQRCQRDLTSAPKPALDPVKLDLCRRAFIFRLRSDESSFQLQKSRLKVFYKLVNDKIQNVRKCLNRNESMNE